MHAYASNIRPLTTHIITEEGMKATYKAAGNCFIYNATTSWQRLRPRGRRSDAEGCGSSVALAESVLFYKSALSLMTA
jgi:hypothetical protein